MFQNKLEFKIIVNNIITGIWKYSFEFYNFENKKNISISIVATSFVQNNPIQYKINEIIFAIPPYDQKFVPTEQLLNRNHPQSVGYV